MRAAINILFGIMLLVSQGMASLTPHTIEKETVCRCCSCGSTTCTPPQSTPAPAPSPIATQECSQESEKVARAEHAPSLLVSTVPVVAPSRIPSQFPSVSTPPLHQRLCILLI